MFRLAALAFLAVSFGYVQKYPSYNRNSYSAPSYKAPSYQAPAYQYPVPIWYNPYPWYNAWWEESSESSESRGDSREDNRDRCRRLTTSCQMVRDGSTCNLATIRYFKENGRMHAYIECPTKGKTNTTNGNTNKTNNNITTHEGAATHSSGNSANKIAQCRHGMWRTQNTDGLSVSFTNVRCLDGTTASTAATTASTAATTASTGTTIALD